MLLPECALRIQRRNGSRIMLAPPALAGRCPPLRGFTRIHAATIDTATDSEDREHAAGHELAMARALAESVGERAKGVGGRNWVLNLSF